MTKQLIPGYVFDPATRTITFTDFGQVRLDRVVLITNVTTGQIIFQFNLPGTGAVVVDNTLVLEYDTTEMSATDSLGIIYDVLATDPMFDKTVVGNAMAKFRDGFASVGGPPPDPAVWDLVNADHLLNAGGNAFGSSYLRISLSPFKADSEVILTSKQVFRFPLKMGFGLTMSQRIIGQEVFAGLVGTDGQNVVETTPQPADRPFSAALAVVTTNVATFTVNNHGLQGGDRVSIFNCLDPRLNVGPAVVTVVDINTFTVPCAMANGSYSTVGGFIRVADPFKYGSGVALNGFGYLFEIATVTTASFVARRGGDKFRSLAATVATTLAIQASPNPYTDAFNAASVNELYASMEEISMRSLAADSVAAPGSIVKFSQAVPEEDKPYKICFRARNTAKLTVPIAQIITIAKTGTTAATVTTDVPHGLTTSDWVQIYGVRDQVNFPNLAAAAVVSSVIDPTHFTVIIGTASTTSSADGTVYQVQGSVLAPGVIPQAVQSASCTNHVLVLVGSGTWATPLPGEFMEVHGLAAAVPYDGPYKVLRVNTTSLELEAPLVPDFVSTPTGGTVIRRTDVRLHFVRCMPHTRLLAEITGGKGQATDSNNAVPVVLTTTAAASAAQSTGSATSLWNAAGPAGVIVIDVASAALTTTATVAAVTPGLLAGIGCYSNSFSVVVSGAPTGAGPTLDIGIEESPDAGVNWVRIYDFPRITAAGCYVSPRLPNIWGSRYRYVQTVGGTTPSFTRAINRLMYSDRAPVNRQFIDRTIVVTTLSSVTPVYNVMGTRNLTLGVKLGLVTTTAPTFKLQGSDDGVSWADVGAPLVGVSNSYAVLNVPGMPFQYARAIVSVAGVAVVSDFVLIRAME